MKKKLETIKTEKKQGTTNVRKANKHNKLWILPLYSWTNIYKWQHTMIMILYWGSLAF